MNEPLISNLLAPVEQEFGIILQVIEQDPYLCIFINRQAESELDYSALTQKICKLLPKEEITAVVGIAFYSRVMGTVDHDWETYIELSSTQDLSAPPSVNQDNEQLEDVVIEDSLVNEQPEDVVIEDSLVNEQPENYPINPITLSDDQTDPYDLSQYCFTRNKGLLTAKILPPSVKIATIIHTLHQASIEQKHQFLQSLKVWQESEEIPILYGLSEDLKQQLKNLTKFNQEIQRKALIWLSRYCINPEETLTQVEPILSPPTAENPPNNSSPEKPSEETHKTSPSSDSRRKSNKSSLDATNKPTKKPHKSSSKGKIPLSWIAAWTAFVIMVIGTTFHSNQPASICSNSKSAYCELAVQMVSGTTLKTASQNAIPITPSLEEGFKETCTTMGNLQAGIDLKTVTQEKIIPPQSLKGEEILPGIYAVDLTQTNYKNGSSSVRIACIITARALGQQMEQSTMNILGVEVIPNNWPEDPYKRPVTSIADLQDSLGIFAIFMMLGAGTLFTTLGIMLAAILHFGIKIDTIQTAVKAAFFFQIIETLFSFFWYPSLFIIIPVNSLLLLLTSAVVKEFKMQWNLGFRMIAGGTAIIVGTRVILGYLLLSLISAII